jgi:hypothetical protein
VRLLCCSLLLTACGRLGFESTAHDGAVADARVMVDAAPGSYADVVSKSGPLVYYRLDETSGMVAADSMPARRDGEYDVDTGVVTHAQPGALSDGTTGVRVAADGNIGPTITAAIRFETSYGNWDGDFTVEVFVKPHMAPPPGWNMAILICETYLTDGFRFGWMPEGFLTVWTDEAGANGGLVTSATLDYSRFNHVALVRNGSRFSIFLDGVNVATDPTFDYIPTVDSTSECGLGSFHGMPSYATFDEVALYDRALTAGELTTHLSAR